MSERLIAEAWVTAQAGDVSELQLRALAEASLASHPHLAMSAYERLAERRIQLGGAGNYDEAVALIRRRALACADAAAQAAYVRELALRHKAKRTFVQRLTGLA